MRRKRPDKVREIAWAELGLDLSREHHAEISRAISAKYSLQPVTGPEKGHSLLEFFGDRLKVYLRDQGAGTTSSTRCSRCRARTTFS